MFSLFIAFPMEIIHFSYLRFCHGPRDANVDYNRDYKGFFSDYFFSSPFLLLV